jgi:predicted O-linked N-acetylglucosamine transferase (SPINDLY family)
MANQAQGRPGEAVHCYGRALAVRPDYTEAWINRGNTLRSLGRAADAEESLRRALTLRPDVPEVHYNLGLILRDLGRAQEAVQCHTQALRLRPEFAEAHMALGSLFRAEARITDAAECFARAVHLRPDYADAHNNLGSALRELGRSAEAADCFASAVRLRPNFAEAHNNRGIALRDLGRAQEAEACFRQALTLRALYAEAHHNLGALLADQGRFLEAEACFRQALQQRPDYLDAHDGLLLALHYQPGVTPADLAVAHADYERRHAAPLRATWRLHANDRDPDRPLRLGFVSADFGRHPVGFLLIRALEALARRPGAVVCYSSRKKSADDLTARFQAASVWRDVAGLNDDRLAELVRADGIDVLIDLAGHTAGNRLLAFARKPAPVQATWLGYEGTTGLAAIDYLIADDRLVPAGAGADYRETVLRLPGGYASYDPPTEAPEPGPQPVLARGRVTFGCFNNPAKLSPPALSAFAAVLRRVPDSRLLLQYRGLDDPSMAGRLRDQITRAGVEPLRVESRGSMPYAEYLAAYREVDVALDPFPFNGGVTTCDALWMGVPVVTQPRDTIASRHGLSYLSTIGLADELVARDANDYVVRAAELVNDLGRLSGLRATLRERMARSPLCDGERLASELLAALRSAWRS